jgi:hypothetical protein
VLFYAALAQHRRDNDELRERFNNCSYIVSDLNTKIKNIEDEKLSLVTALKLLQEDSKSVSLNNRDAIHNTWHTPGHKARANVHNTSANHACQTKTARSADMIAQEQVIKTPNRFSLLSTDHDSDKDLEANDEADLTESSTSTIRQRNSNSDPNKHDKQRNKESQSTRTSAEIPKVKAKTNNRKNTTNANSNDHKSGKLVFIAGDSILQHVHGWNLSNDDQRVSVKSFSGSKVEDMQDYIKPLLRKKPDEIILHVGTNDIKDNSKTAEVVAAGILNLGTQVKESLPRTNVCISGIITRKDKSNIQEKINTVNDILKRVSDLNKWTYIDNTNLDYTCLNRGGLHLNRKGSSSLTRNYSNHLSRN